MKTVFDLFTDTWRKKEERGWDYVYIMIDLHGVILPSNYHSVNDLQFIHPYTKKDLEYLSDQEDIKLILWTSSYVKEVAAVTSWLANQKIYFDYVNENPDEKNNGYADFSKKPYFSILLDDKSGFTENDWDDINVWIAVREMGRLK